MMSDAKNRMILQGADFGQNHVNSEKKVLRDKDLAELYDLETKRLKVDVRKNVKQFPTDFVHEIYNEEQSNWRL